MSEPDPTSVNKRILLIIGGGIAAYKCLELIRRGQERGLNFRCVLTEAGSNFVTPLSVSGISGDKVYTDLFSLTDEAEMGHIRLSREADLVVVAPATADLMAKMANGLGNDLASTVLLATDKNVLLAPAMNPEMWGRPATQRNVEQLRADGISFVGPEPGDMACGEVGLGRLSEPERILEAIDQVLRDQPRPLTGKRAVVTSGPTHEAIDPVRYIANHSSGRQGHALAAALAEAGAEVTLVTGPVNLKDPKGVVTRHVRSAREMLAVVEGAMPSDIAIFAAAVADWRPESVPDSKIKKSRDTPEPLRLVENPDILREIGTRDQGRPKLVIGFAAETDDLVENAEAKRRRKNADWIVANDVRPENKVFGGSHNTVSVIRRDREPENWPRMEKKELASRIVGLISKEIAS